MKVCEGVFDCQKCKKIYTNSLAHDSHSSEIKCHSCHSIFKSEKSFGKHICKKTRKRTLTDSHNTDNTVQPCKRSCNSVQTNQTAIVQPCVQSTIQSTIQSPVQSPVQSTVQSRDVLCEVCGRIFNSERALSAHKSYHKKNHRIRCRRCLEEFQDRHSLNIHVRDSHSQRGRG